MKDDPRHPWQPLRSTLISHWPDGRAYKTNYPFSRGRFFAYESKGAIATSQPIERMKATDSFEKGRWT